MAVLPAKATLTGGESLTLSCDTQGVTWVGPDKAGQLTPKGQFCVYTAPPKYQIWITRDIAIAAELNGQDKGSAVITLLSAPIWVATLAITYGLLFTLLVAGVIWIWPPPPAVASLDVSPPIVTVAPGVTQPFEARIWNARDQGVTWTATEGFITPNGLFTASSSSGSRSVLGVTSVADHNLTQSALILLNPKGLSVLPTSATLSIKGKASFQAMEYGASGSKFDWAVSDSSVQVVAKANGNVDITAVGPITAPKRVIVTVTDHADRTREAGALLYLSPTEGPLEESDQTRDRRLLELVILMGALGALLGASRSLGNFVGNGAFFPRWSLFYLFRPTFGAGLALLVFFGYRIGAVTGVKTTGPADPFAATFVAGMVGLFADTVLQKLKDLVTALFPSHDERTDKVTTTVHAPAIESAEGSKAAGKMTIKGANFVSGAIVTFDLKPRATTFVNPNELTATLDPSDQASKVKVIVTNPDKGASAAFEGTISA